MPKSDTISQLGDLPKDPIMLFSVINMKLRDYYDSLDELCEDLNVERSAIEATFPAAGFDYSEEHRKFR